MPLNTDYDIGAAFRVIEEELIASMMRNMKRHFQEETQLDMDWTAWQAEQLYALDQYKRRTEKKYGKEFYHLNERMEELIRQANASGRMDQELEILEAIKKGMDLHRQKGAALRFFKVNERKLNALIKATRADMEKAETAILRMSQDRYRQIIFNAQVYANTGAGTYEKAVDMATKDFMMAGLNCVEYKNGARHTLSDYADMAIRTASKRAYLQGEGEVRQEWGIHTVIINKRSDNPCPKCLPFVGKVMIDDVWSGGSRKDGDYPLMSEAVAAGLYHPRCRDSHTTYFPGISTKPDDKFTKEEVEEIEEKASLEQKMGVAKRNFERFDRAASNSMDKENDEDYRGKADYWKGEYEKYYKMTDPSNANRKMKADSEQFERYQKVLGNEAPKNLADFRRIKYNDVAGYGKLKHTYRVANQYELNSGKMPASKITELHDEAVKQKSLFNSKGRKGSNIGIMNLDGETFIANSRAEKENDPITNGFKGDRSKLILRLGEQRFKTTIIGTHDRGCDSEAKLFEYAARIADDGKPHVIQLLSEKCMCESCRGVMDQFKERYPKVTVNAVSHKSEKAVRNRNYNRTMEYDVDKAVKDANKR